MPRFCCAFTVLVYPLVQEDVKKKRLVAAAAAYVAVHAKGRAVVNLQKDLSAVILGLRLRICRVC